MHEPIGELERMAGELFKLRMCNRILSRRLKDNGITDNVTDEEVESEIESEYNKYLSRSISR